MKRIRYLPLLWLCLCHWMASAQTFTGQVTALQYFYDTDPGINTVGNGGIISVTPAAEITTSLSLPLPPGISSGIHYLYVRAKDEYGRWSVPDRRPLLVTAESAYTDQVTAWQYYFDTDPGIGIPGNGGVVNVTPGAMVSNALSLSIPTLSNGMHQLYVRAKDEHGRWSIADRRAFMVSGFDALTETITQIQYYVDADPGVGVAGNGAILNVTPSEVVSTSLAIDVTGYAAGFHQLYVRARDIYGRWSIIERRPFLIMSNDEADGQVVALQYYFDTDPGVGIPGNGGIENVTPSEVHTGTYAWELPTLSNGMHQLYVRAKNANGTWSEITRHAFYILTNEQSTQILALEYYFDNDPGAGNGNPIAITPTDVFDTPLSIGVPCLSTGTHYAYLRAKDEHGHWSIIARDTLTVTGGVATAVVSPAGPVTICTGDEVVLSATAAPGVSYQWLLDGAPIAGATTTVYTATTAGSYSLKSTCGVAFTTSNVVTVNTLPLITYFADADSDGFGDPAVTAEACSAPTGFVVDNTDCNDTENSIHPFASEICNGVDENCNGMIDEGALTSFYADADGDGFGNVSDVVLACSVPVGFVANASDCNDMNASVNPSGIEVCNLIDDNCNAITDEGVTSTFYADADGDSYGNAGVSVNACTAPTGYVSDASDCNDADAFAIPGQTWYIDADGDDYAAGIMVVQCTRPANGFVAIELIDIAADCNDADPSVHPAAAELCNTIDDNCNADIDEGVLLTFYADMDTDGFGDATETTLACAAPVGYVSDDTDCNDADATAFPGQTYYADMDADDYGSGVSTISCAAPAGYALAADLLTITGDCDDTDPLINPVAQYYTYSGNTNFTSALVFPPNGDSYDVFQFEVAYFDAANGMPSGSYPRMALDYENNGVFTNPNDRIIVLTPADPSDLNTADGKIYFGSIDGLTPGFDWTAKILTGTSCVSSFGPFADFIVTEEPDLEIFASDITFSDFEPDPLDEITVFATIQNTAVTPAAGFFVRLENQFDGTVYPDVWVNNLNAGASTTVSWNITTPAIAAWCPMLVTIDPTNTVTESNELDNYAVRPFVNGEYYIPGGIDVMASVSPASVYYAAGSSVFVSGNASYFGLAVPLPDPDVAGAEVSLTIVETGASFMGYTNVDGYFYISVPAGLPLGTYHIQGSVTDFTLTGTMPELTFQVIPAPLMPDLETQVYLSASTIVAGGSVDGSIIVTNVGNLTTGIATLLDISQSGGTPAIGDVIVPVLDPGQSYTYNFYGVVLNTPGVYSFCGLADAAYSVTELFEFNNSDCSSVLVVSPDPDLYGGGSAAGGSCDIPPSSLSLTITNGGLTATGDFESRLYTSYNGIPQGYITFITPSILPGQSAGVSMPFVNYGYGDYSYTVELDYNSMITESSDINNDFSFGGTYYYCLPDLVIGECNGVQVNTDDAISPALLEISATIHNAGYGMATGPIDVEFAMSDGSIYSATYPGNLAAGASQIVSISVAAPANGTVLTSTVNPDHIIAEDAYFNNDHTGDLCWDMAVQPLCTSDFWESTYVVNSFVYPAIAIHAYDMYPAVNVPVRFELAGPGIIGTMHLGDAVLPNVTQTCGSCGILAVAPDAYMFLEPGVYTCTMTVDPDGIYADCVPANNQLIVSIYVTGDPDMVVLSEYIHPSLLNPASGESVSFNVTYANNGFENVGASMTMQVLVDDVVIDEISGVPGLLTGDNYTIAIPATWSSTLEGAHVVKAVIDAYDEVFESTNLNNTATRAIIVGAAANLGFEFVTVSNDTPVAGEVIDIQMHVTNTGASPTVADVYLYYVTNDMDTINIGIIPFALSGNDTVELSWPWSVIDPQTTILAEIINSSVLEFDYTDNYADVTIGSFSIDLDVINESCLDAADGSISVSVSGGEAPFVIAWNTGAYGSVLYAAPGAYLVTVTDNTGMSVTAEATIGASISPVLSYYADVDGDGYGDADATTLSCSGAPAGYVSDNTDCDDTTAMVHPAAAEVCNGIDDNCDGNSDEGLVFVTYYADADGDSYGNAATTTFTCDGAPSGYVANATDCNDADVSINPGSAEVCNGVDDDCDGITDEGVLLTFYADGDGDTFGNADAFTLACASPSGYVSDNTDCNDGNAAINPAAVEICNDTDDNCDGAVDEGLEMDMYFADTDGDGYGNADEFVEACAIPEGYGTDATDCDDANASINSGAVEIPANGIDEDCDGSDGGAACTLTIDAGANEETYFGLAMDQTVIRSAIITGGVAPFTTTWTLSRPLLCDMVNADGDEVFSAAACVNNICPAGALTPSCTGTTLTAKLIDTAVVYVTVTDANGCVAVDSFTIFAEDVRCFAGKSNNYKIRLCHQTGSPTNPCVTICVDENAVPAHIAEHGDVIGSCNVNCTARMIDDIAEMDVLKVYPNPADEFCTISLHVSDQFDEKADIELIGITGQNLMQWQMQMIGGSLIEELYFDENLPSGIYSIRIVIGETVFSAPIVLTR